MLVTTEQSELMNAARNARFDLRSIKPNRGWGSRHKIAAYVQAMVETALNATPDEDSHCALLAREIRSCADGVKALPTAKCPHVGGAIPKRARLFA